MPHTNPRDWNPDAAPNVDDEPLETYYRERAEEIFYRLDLNPPTDPEERGRLEGELAYWKAQVRAATIDDHWTAGAGDRTLF